MTAKGDAPDSEVDRLYELPLDQFVERRDELARRRRREGARDEADRIKALRKPSAAAGIVNRVVRSEPERRKALLAAADALRSAQEDVQRGKADASRLRRAGEDEREAVEALVEAARRLDGDGQAANEPTLERVRETLHAAALDPEARRQVEEARLTRELSAIGFGVAAGPSPPPAARGRKSKTSDRAREPDDAGEAERRRAESANRRAAAEDELEAARGRAKEARAAVTDARRELQRTMAAREQAQRRLERAEAEAERSDSRVKSAREILKGLPRR